MLRKFGKVLLLLMILSLVACAFAACDGDKATISNSNGDPSDPTDATDTIEHRVLTASMEPTLIMGHTYLFQRINNEMTFQVNDIVLVTYEVVGYSDPITTARRIVEIVVTDGVTSYVMQGDGNIIRDASPYQRGQILGKYIGEKK